MLSKDKACCCFGASSGYVLRLLVEALTEEKQNQFHTSLSM